MTFPRVDGIDIHPAYQPVSNWDLIPQYDLVSVKICEGASTQTPGSTEYVRQMRRRGFRFRGFYAWVRPDCTAQQQFDNLARAVDRVGGLQDVGEFIQSDWERTLDAKGQALPMPTLSLVMRFHELIQREWPGKLIVYVSDWVTGFLQWLAQQPPEPIWYANYNTDPLNRNGGWQECVRFGATVWQTGSSLLVPGIDDRGVAKRTDSNHILNRPALDRLAGYPSAGGGDTPGPIEVEPPPPVVVTPTNAPFQETDVIIINGRNQYALDDAGYVTGLSADTLAKNPGLPVLPLTDVEWDEKVAISEARKRADAAAAHPASAPSAPVVVESTVTSVLK